MSITVPDAPPIPDTYTPVTVFGAALINALAPWMTLHLAWYCDAIGVFVDPVYTLVMGQGMDNGITPTVGTYVDGVLVTEGYEPGYGMALNPQTATVDQLAYLAQYVGVKVPAGADYATALSLVTAESGMNRGTPAAVIAAVKRFLTGTKSVGLVERTYVDGTPNAGWFLVIVRPEEAQTTNIVPNPSFEHDTSGASPAGWSDLSGWSTSVVQNSWAARGSQSLRLTFTTGYTGTGTAVVGTFNTRGAFPVVAGQQIAVSAVVNVYSVVGTVELYLQGSFFPASGGGIGITTNIVSGPGVQTLSALMTVPTGMINANFTVEAVNVGGGGSTTIDFAIDDVLVAMNVSSVPAYFDGDTPGYSWTGTPGDSSSASSLQPLEDAIDAVKFGGLMWTLVLSDAPLVDQYTRLFSAITASLAAATITDVI